MAAAKGTSLIRLLHTTAASQVAKSHPAGQLSAPVFATAPAQSILRRFFADGTQTIDRAKIEAADATQKGKEYAEEKTEQAKETVSDVADKAKEGGANVADKVKESAGREMNTASDMVKDLPEKTKETAQNLKEVGIEAAKAVKRDTSRLAEKVGLKTPSN